MKKIMAIILTAIIISGILFVIMPDEVDAELITPLTFDAIPASTAGIYSASSDYWQAVNGTNYPTALAPFWFGEYLGGGAFSYVLIRGVATFNTTMDENKTIQTVEVEMPFDLASSIDITTNFTIEVYSVDYGPTLDYTDWNATKIYLANFSNTTYMERYGVYRCQIPVQAVNKSGLTKLMFVATIEGKGVPIGDSIIRPSDFPTLYINSEDLGEVEMDYVFEPEVARTRLFVVGEHNDTGVLLRSRNYYPSEVYMDYTTYSDPKQVLKYDLLFLDYVDHFWIYPPTGTYNWPVSYMNFTQTGSGGDWSLNITTNFTTGHYSWWVWISPEVQEYADFEVSIYPYQKTEVNATHDLYRYDFQGFDEVGTIFWNMTTSDYTYLSMTPDATFTTINATRAEYKITGVDWDSTYSIWFTRPKPTVFTELSIALTHATLGTGIMWEELKVMINEGTEYNSTLARRIANPTTFISYNQNYTVTVLDFFDNEITNKTLLPDDIYYDLIIDIPVHQLNVKSFRLDTTAYAIYFNATGTPYQDHIPGEEYDELPIKEGTYMFRFDFLDSTANGTTTSIGTYFYNLTINGTYTINIGTSVIEIIQTTINGNTISINTIETWVMPSIYYNLYEMPHAPVGGTRAIPTSSLSFTVLRVHPFHIIEASTYDNTTLTTSYSFDDPRPDEGSVVMLKDVLQIYSDWNTHIMVNATNGTNLINLTNPQTVNMLPFGEENYTLWSNKSVNAYRENRWRQSNIFYWNYYMEYDKWASSLLVNNTSGFTWYDVKWDVTIVNNTVMDLVDRRPQVYDQNNSLLLEPGVHYTLSIFSFSLDWDSLSTNTYRAFTFVYFETNKTYDETEIITAITSGWTADFRDGNYYYSEAVFQNMKDREFLGEINIKLEGLLGTIDPSSVMVYDEGQGQQISTNEFSFSGNTVFLTQDAIRGVSGANIGSGVMPGESRTYTVYFTYSNADPVDSDLFSPWFIIPGLGWGFSFHTLLLIGAVLIGGRTAFFHKGEEKYKIIYYELAGLLFASWTVLLILNEQGVFS